MHYKKRMGQLQTVRFGKQAKKHIAPATARNELFFALRMPLS
jgi:hypothetical protein